MIYANGPRDTVRAAFERYTRRPCIVLLACPFFSQSILIEELLQRGCTIRLIIRLSSATKPQDLKEVLNHNVAVRFFTSSLFHSKLYIFGDEAALIGSANLTDAGIQSNQEICIAIDRADTRYERLVQLFQGYWDQSTPLDEEKLSSFALIHSQHGGASRENNIDSDIRKKLGDIAPSGLQVSSRRSSQDQVYVHSYRQTYQEFLVAYREIERLYRETGRRRQPEERVPLRIEIDSFFSFIRERFAGGERYNEAPLLAGAECTRNVTDYIHQWFETEWPYLDEVIPESYAELRTVFSNLESLSGATYEQLLDALLCLHSFHDQRRFHLGAIEALRKNFTRDNQIEKVRLTLAYLLFGPGDYISRMANCIFSPHYYLSWFGRSCVQELYGWMNAEEIPICNGRTVKSIRFLGFSVKIF